MFCELDTTSLYFANTPRQHCSHKTQSLVLCGVEVSLTVDGFCLPHGGQNSTPGKMGLNSVLICVTHNKTRNNCGSEYFLFGILGRRAANRGLWMEEDRREERACPEGKTDTVVVIARDGAPDAEGSPRSGEGRPCGVQAAEGGPRWLTVPPTELGQKEGKRGMKDHCKTTEGYLPSLGSKKNRRRFWGGGFRLAGSKWSYS